MTFDVWLRTVCFKAPTKEAFDLAKSAWEKSRAEAFEEVLGILTPMIGSITDDDLQKGINAIRAACLEKG